MSNEYRKELGSDPGRLLAEPGKPDTRPFLRFGRTESDLPDRPVERQRRCEREHRHIVGCAGTFGEFEHRMHAHFRYGPRLHFGVVFDFFSGHVRRAADHDQRTCGQRFAAFEVECAVRRRHHMRAVEDRATATVPVPTLEFGKDFNLPRRLGDRYLRAAYDRRPCSWEPVVPHNQAVFMRMNRHRPPVVESSCPRNTTPGSHQRKRDSHREHSNST
jgi:hypothetical protein